MDILNYRNKKILEDSIKSLRMVLGLTVDDLANILGVTRATMIKMEYRGITFLQYYSLMYVFNEYAKEDILFSNVFKRIFEDNDYSIQFNTLCSTIFKQTGTKFGMSVISDRIRRAILDL